MPYYAGLHVNSPQKMQGQSIAPEHAKWRVGPNGTRIEGLRLASLEQVSSGRWQPRLFYKPDSDFDPLLSRYPIIIPSIDHSPTCGNHELLPLYDPYLIRPSIPGYSRHRPPASVPSPASSTVYDSVSARKCEGAIILC